MNPRTITLMRAIFIAGAVWNLIGAIFGYFNTTFTFERFFGRELADPLVFEIYQGAWGTTFVYFFGYLIVAQAPLKRVGIVIVGGIGKVGYAIKLTQLYTAGLADAVVLIVIVGDFLFCVLFAWYFVQVYREHARSSDAPGLTSTPAPAGVAA